MSDNPKYQGKTHTDDVIEAIRRGVWGKVVRKLGGWQERLIYLQTRHMDDVFTRSEINEIVEIANELDLSLPPLLQSPNAETLIAQCLDEIHHLLTGHRREDKS